MVEHLNLRYLSYFVTTADQGSMTRAAHELRVSQPAISQALGELERQLGVTLLFRRRALGVTLTPAGQRVLAEARILLSEADNLRVDVHNFTSSLSGNLVVGCAQTIAPFLVPRLIRDFTSAYPDITLDYTEGTTADLLQQLRTGVCEAAILYDMNEAPGFDSEVLYRMQPYVALPAEHPLADLSEIPLTALADQDMVVIDFPESESYVRSLVASAGITPRIRYRSSSFEMVRSLVARGFGFSILHQRPATDTSYEGLAVITRPIAGPIADIGVVLATPLGLRRTRRAQALVDFCHTTFGENSTETHK